MDGFEAAEGVIVVAATNYAESLDAALTRPGRFDRNVAVPLPDVRGRLDILTHYLKVRAGCRWAPCKRTRGQLAAASGPPPGVIWGAPDAMADILPCLSQWRTPSPLPRSLLYVSVKVLLGAGLAWWLGAGNSPADSVPDSSTPPSL
jgi:hypothetical protein